MNNIENLYNTYFHDVYLYIKSVSRDDEIAQEITQDTFFKAMSHLTASRGIAALKAGFVRLQKIFSTTTVIYN